MFNDGYGDYYVRNRNCHCPRCMAYWLMGPAILITVGVLFLLEQLHIARFGQTVPILLIVIGLIKIAQRSAPDMGHVQPAPYYPPGMYPPPGAYPPQSGRQQSSPPTIDANRPNSEVNRG